MNNGREEWQIKRRSMIETEARGRVIQCTWTIIVRWIKVTFSSSKLQKWRPPPVWVSLYGSPTERKLTLIDRSQKVAAGLTSRPDRHGLHHARLSLRISSASIPYKKQEPLPAFSTPVTSKAHKIQRHIIIPIIYRRQTIWRRHNLLFVTPTYPSSPPTNLESSCSLTGPNSPTFAFGVLLLDYFFFSSFLPNVL